MGPNSNESGDLVESISYREDSRSFWEKLHLIQFLSTFTSSLNHIKEVVLELESEDGVYIDCYHDVLYVFIFFIENHS